jgi:hypothetical protein
VKLELLESGEDLASEFTKVDRELLADYSKALREMGERGGTHDSRRIVR